MPRALLINPWIHDFSAFDLWACPLGLLSLGAVIRAGGWEVDFLDFTDRQHPRNRGEAERDREFHVGKYRATEIRKPQPIAWVPRRFKRYGMPPKVVESILAGLPRPDAILVTSRMTYWYPGVVEAIGVCRRVFPGVPVVLGGNYATLCPGHARRICSPDVVFEGEGEARVAGLLEELTGKPLRPGDGGGAPDPANLDTLPVPAWDLLSSTRSVAIETSRGCPYGCSYCATGNLHPVFRRKSPARVADEIEYATGALGAEDIAFYDDALLLEPGEHFELIAAEVGRRNLRARFHAPNGLFASMITPAVAEALKRIGLETVRISLESASRERLLEWNRRITPSHFVDAMRNLREAGFVRRQLGVYLLCALPGQDPGEVREAIDFVVEHGGTPRLAEYSPIPGTPGWKRAVETSHLPLEDEPLLQNNSIYWWASKSLARGELAELKQYAWERVREAGAGRERTGS